MPPEQAGAGAAASRAELRAEWRRWLAVVLLAAAMAWMEAAAVLYLRTLLGRVEPYQAQPLPINPHLSRIEVIREAATLTLLASAAWLAGGTRARRWGYFLVAFGAWDLLYYLFLAGMGPWPRSALAWDVLFLIPFPWWGPVLAPCLIAAGMVLFGTLLTQNHPAEQQRWPAVWSWWVCGAGALLALGLFMADSLGLAAAGRAETTALAGLLPDRFLWTPFLLALALMAAPILSVALRILSAMRDQPGPGVTDTAG